jgi:ketosteroid isomerase-like protein
MVDAVLSSISPRQVHPMKVDAHTEQQVLSTMDLFFDAYSRRDLSGVMARFLPDPDVVLIGTESDERLVGLHAIGERLQDDWSRTDELSMKTTWYSLSGTKDVCWMAAEIVVSVSAEGNRLQLPARITIVLERRAEQWLIAQWHSSLARE